MSIKFRPLKADEVDCKVKMVKNNGVMILLYKDARVDQRLLDEVVGPENWQRSHEVINGNLYCNVGIRINREPGFGELVWKQDVGTESQTEAEKGQASDAFKRACFNWGLGRELYTAPFIWIPADKCNINGTKCYDKFVCTHMEVVDGTITALSIANQNRNGQEVFRYGNTSAQPSRPAQAPQQSYGHGRDTAEDAAKNQALQAQAGVEKIDAIKIKTIEKEINKKGLAANSILQHYKLTRFDDMTISQWTNAMQLLQQYPDRK